MITPQNLVRHELIGLQAKVVQSPHPSFQGLEGRVVDETRNTLTLEVCGKEKVVPKEGPVFSFTLPSGKQVRVEGMVLVGRPEDRIKKKLRKW